MSEAIFNKINELLLAESADFRVIEHIAVGTSQEVADARGTELGQGAKALVCSLKGVKVDIIKRFYPDNTFYANIASDTCKANVLAVLPADHSANLELLAKVFDAKKASLASPSEVDDLTDCIFGSIPPFSFNERLLLAVDERLFYKFKDIAFNAGLLNRSIILKTDDYKRIVKPVLINFAYLR